MMESIPSYTSILIYDGWLDAFQGLSLTFSTFLVFSVWDWTDSRLEANFEDARSVASNSWTPEHVSVYYQSRTFSCLKVALSSIHLAHSRIFCQYVCG